MEKQKKRVLLLGLNHMKGREDIAMHEFREGDSMLTLTHREEGLDEEFLKTTLHRHEFYELVFVYGGRATQILGATPLEIGVLNCVKVPSRSRAITLMPFVLSVQRASLPTL